MSELALRKSYLIVTFCIFSKQLQIAHHLKEEKESLIIVALKLYQREKTVKLLK